MNSERILVLIEAFDEFPRLSDAQHASEMEGRGCPAGAASHFFRRLHDNDRSERPWRAGPHNLAFMKSISNAPGPVARGARETVLAEIRHAHRIVAVSDEPRRAEELWAIADDLHRANCRARIDVKAFGLAFTAFRPADGLQLNMLTQRAGRFRSKQKSWAERRIAAMLAAAGLAYGPLTLDGLRAVKALSLFDAGPIRAVGRATWRDMTASGVVEFDWSGRATLTARGENLARHISPLFVEDAAEYLLAPHPGPEEEALVLRRFSDIVAAQREHLDSMMSQCAGKGSPQAIPRGDSQVDARHPRFAAEGTTCS
jgi:hypothetical protein